jgi:hypothetical protein
MNVVIRSMSVNLAYLNLKKALASKYKRFNTYIEYSLLFRIKSQQKKHKLTNLNYCTVQYARLSVYVYFIRN